MAVLVEAMSVIIRREAILEKFAGGWPAFVARVPNQTLCFDAWLVRVGFMFEADLQEFCRLLEWKGLEYEVDGVVRDFVVATQQGGFGDPCPWAEFGRVTDVRIGGTIAYCRARAQDAGKVAVPAGWRFDRSLSEESGFTSAEDWDKEFEYLGREGSLDVYLRRATGKRVYVGRTRPIGN